MCLGYAMPALPRFASRATLAAAGVAMLAAPAGSDALSGACTPSRLTAAMTVVRGSAGAGQISYNVRLKNHSSGACTVSGRPVLRLLDAHGHGLPTKVVPDRPGTGTAALIRLAHGASAVALARFSPDVPGQGESGSGPCEKTAYSVRITLASPGHGSLVGKVRPATPVCEHGRIVLGLLHAAR
jgi:hypothetical protein